MKNNAYFIKNQGDNKYHVRVMLQDLTKNPLRGERIVCHNSWEFSTNDEAVEKVKELISVEGAPIYHEAYTCELKKIFVLKYEEGYEKYWVEIQGPFSHPQYLTLMCDKCQMTHFTDAGDFQVRNLNKNDVFYPTNYDYYNNKININTRISVCTNELNIIQASIDFQNDSRPENYELKIKLLKIKQKYYTILLNYLKSQKVV